MDEIKRLTPAQRARCNRLIRRLCANYDGGNCLPLDDGEGCVCVQMISYDDMSSIKRIADGFNIAILLVHHLRKLQDSDDPFNDVSGSTGIIGAADTNFILRRKRSGNAATLLVSGRDVEYQELSLQFNDLVWELVERKNSEDIHKAELPKFLFRVVDFMGFERGGGTGRILCINTAFAEFRRAGAELYKEALTILLEAWGGDPDSLRAEVIQGIVHFVELYHGEYDRERLIYSIRAYEPKFIYAAGKAEKELRGIKRYVNLFYRIYNGRRKHEILPMKF